MIERILHRWIQSFNSYSNLLPNFFSLLKLRKEKYTWYDVNRMIAEVCAVPPLARYQFRVMVLALHDLT